jgi:hypothetical protein
MKESQSQELLELVDMSIARQLLGKKVSATQSNIGTIAQRRCFLWVCLEAI